MAPGIPSGGESWAQSRAWHLYLCSKPFQEPLGPFKDDFGFHLRFWFLS